MTNLLEILHYAVLATLLVMSVKALADFLHGAAILKQSHKNNNKALREVARVVRNNVSLMAMAKGASDAPAGMEAPLPNLLALLVVNPVADFQAALPLIVNQSVTGKLGWLKEMSGAAVLVGTLGAVSGVGGAMAAASNAHLDLGKCGAALVSTGVGVVVALLASFLGSSLASRIGRVVAQLERDLWQLRRQRGGVGERGNHQQVVDALEQQLAQFESLNQNLKSLASQARQIVQNGSAVQRKAAATEPRSIHHNLVELDDRAAARNGKARDGGVRIATSHRDDPESFE